MSKDRGIFAAGSTRRSPHGMQILPRQTSASGGVEIAVWRDRESSSYSLVVQRIQPQINVGQLYAVNGAARVACSWPDGAVAIQLMADAFSLVPVASLVSVCVLAGHPITWPVGPVMRRVCVRVRCPVWRIYRPEHADRVRWVCVCVCVCACDLVMTLNFACLCWANCTR